MATLLKTLTFQAMHTREYPFVLPNPWDAGSAKILEALGYEALATTSAGLAFSLGRRDGESGLFQEQKFSATHCLS
jgi:2-methylisocitrate lyase-like PEP mutase family enzyme